MKSDSNQIEIYIHIPFCVRKCNYCDFLSFSVSDEVKMQYVAAIKKQIAGESRESEYTYYSDKVVRSIYFGGGTPSALNADMIIQILGTVKASYHIADECEITIEVNPGTVDLDKLSALKEAGFNRLSIGLQSANKDELALLGRIHSYEQFIDCYMSARVVGFSNINVDIMTALPGQTVDKLMMTLEKVTELEPEHISTYSLIIEEGTPFFEQYGHIEGPVVGERQERELYWECCDYLKKRGYRHYEISNFAKEGYESLHNCGYWKRIPYVGFGLGAASLVQSAAENGAGRITEYRIQNTEFMAEYLMDPMVKKEISKLEAEEIAGEYMFLGLRMASGINYNEYYDRFGIRAEEKYSDIISKLLKQELIVATDEGFGLSRKGIDYGNYVFAEFVT